MFPNPVGSAGEVTFTYPSRGEASVISIYNIEGKEVATYRLPQWSSVQHVKLPKLANGVYLAQMLNAQTSEPGNVNSTANVKFIVE